MVPDSDTVPIRSQYTRRIAADIDANHQEQERLKARLVQLQEDEAWLVSLQSASQQEPVPEQEDIPATSVFASDTAGFSLPQPREADPASTALPHSTDEEKVKPAGSAKAAKKTTAAGPKAAQPSLRSLVQEVLLRNSSGPRSAGEVLTELEAAHPRRNASPQTVRNALESLIASGAATRERQGRSVYYTLKPTASQTAAEASRESAAIEA